jgi:hypothetical protein
LFAFKLCFLKLRETEDNTSGNSEGDANQPNVALDVVASRQSQRQPKRQEEGDGSEEETDHSFF